MMKKKLFSQFFPEIFFLISLFFVAISILILSFHLRGKGVFSISRIKGNQPKETPLVSQPSETFPPPPHFSSLAEDFALVLPQLNTSQKLVEYLNKNFILENKEADFSQSPLEFFSSRRGNRADLATFSSYVLMQNGHFSTILRYKFLTQDGKEGVKTLVLFNEEGTPKYLDLKESGVEIFSAGNSIQDLFEAEEKKENIKIIEYSAFTFGTRDFTKGDWLPK